VVALPDVAAVVEDDPRAVAGHDAFVEAEEDPEVANGPRGAVDGDAEGAIRGDPGDSPAGAGSYKGVSRLIF
jgi:hypothetical protein